MQCGRQFGPLRLQHRSRSVKIIAEEIFAVLALQQGFDAFTQFQRRRQVPTWRKSSMDNYSMGGPVDQFSCSQPGNQLFSISCSDNIVDGIVFSQGLNTVIDGQKMNFVISEDDTIAAVKGLSPPQSLQRVTPTIHQIARDPYVIMFGAK